MDDASNKKKSVDNKAHVSTKKKPNKKGRIIIRNLSFKVSLKYFCFYFCTRLAYNTYCIP